MAAKTPPKEGLAPSYNLFSHFKKIERVVVVAGGKAPGVLLGGGTIRVRTSGAT